MACGQRHMLSDQIASEGPRPGFSTSPVSPCGLKHLPETGETFRHDGWTFEIVDMDGRKIDKLIASRSKRKASAIPDENAA